MRCLVTGATGFIGSRLVSRLLTEGHEVRCLVRSSSRAERLPGRVDLVRGDILDPAAVRTALDHIDWVFHNAALIYHYSPRAIYRTNFGGMLNLLRGCVGRASVRRVVYSSSIAAMGPCRHPPADESQLPAPLSFDYYGRSKLAAETACRRFASDHDVPFSIIRMAGVYGPGSPLFRNGLRLIEHGFFLLPGPDRLCAFAHVDDICDALLLAASRDEARNRDYIIVDDRPVTIRQLVERVGTLMGRRVRIYRLPLALVRPGIRVLERLSATLRIGIPVTRAIVEYFVRDHRYSSERAKRELGWLPRYPDPLDGARTLVDWYQREREVDRRAARTRIGL